MSDYYDSQIEFEDYSYETQEQPKVEENKLAENNILNS